MKERYMKIYKSEMRKVKTCIYLNKKEANKQFRRKMNHDLIKKRKLLWKEMGKTKGGQMENSNMIRDWQKERMMCEGLEREGYGQYA